MPVGHRFGSTPVKPFPQETDNGAQETKGPGRVHLI